LASLGIERQGNPVIEGTTGTSGGATGHPECKVCFVVNNLSLAGAERQVVSLSLEHRRQGHRVDLITLLPNAAPSEELREAGVITHELNFLELGRLGTIRALREAVDGISPQIVHSHLYHSNMACRFALRGDVPLICTIHSSVETSAYRYRMYRLTEQWCDLTTIVSTQGLESFLEHTNLSSRGKASIAKNGLDVEAWVPHPDSRERTRSALGLHDEFVWLAIGRHMVAKNYPLLIEAFAAHLRDRKDSVLLMAGDGEDRKALERLAQGLLVSERVRFLGVRTDLRELFSACDAHIMSSRLEGLPMVLLEAGAAGIYSVATDVGSISQVLDGGRLGHLVRSENRPALAAAMNEVAGMSRETLLARGEKAREFVKQHYAIDKVVDEWMTIYQETICAR
jgi:glycosyltransferase involved in cell wall biosynthesis